MTRGGAWAAASVVRRRKEARREIEAAWPKLPAIEASVPSGAKAPVLAEVITAGLKPRPFKTRHMKPFVFKARRHLIVEAKKRRPFKAGLA
jgi:hypothetical protein